jgi:Zn-dependent peptidase ImmA (M78 family)
MTLSPAESLLLELGVVAPSEINLPVIAHYLGASIKYSELDGCEARIIGVNDRAVIRVRKDTHPRRQRFSIAHELGHWQLHRGYNLVCGESDFRPGSTKNKSREAAANSFAGKLLLPGYLLDKAASQHGVIDFASIGKIADEFDASHTATALRLLERRHAPMIFGFLQSICAKVVEEVH